MGVGYGRQQLQRARRHWRQRGHVRRAAHLVAALRQGRGQACIWGRQGPEQSRERDLECQKWSNWLSVIAPPTLNQVT